MLALLQRPRLPFFTLALVVIGLLGFGLYLQHVEGLVPCPMCIMQRYAFVLVALIALLAGAHGSRGRGRKGWALLIALVAVAGLGVAARQSWIQRFPPDTIDCGPGLEYMIDSFPLGEALPMIFQGAGECTAIDWSFLGLSIANWSLLCFAAVIGFALCIIFRRAHHNG
ncbi:disulfide bond formation protein B [Nitrogeniibacter mangrovi]|uniref:Disulfide bond formation protein B n=1 Tax=Nitrogeniibacter mangrovi TaxID=2016596 RepID=A0A6C1B9R5_9RHOO|nr:disulfide bond formation protein B [Nitrogeniibacter mangrovi]QID19004.1 disulfide bond formation protein B [Nitrogeniibacter mangrovi]